MNKRQRKKQYVRAFSKAYDESMKYVGVKGDVSISTVRDRRGTVRMFTSLNKNVSAEFSLYDFPQITIEALLLYLKVIKRQAHE